MNMQRAGFTLVEVVIAIGIMTILTVVILTALPKARSNQLLRSDVIQLHTLFANAAQQALNEIRSEACLAVAGDDEVLQRRCSDVGVALVDTERITFADLDGDKQYSSSGDFEIESSSAAAYLADEAQFSIVFAAVPPTVTTYINGEIIGAGDQVQLTLTVDDANREILIGSYGVIENGEAQ